MSLVIRSSKVSSRRSKLNMFWSMSCTLLLEDPGEEVLLRTVVVMYQRTIASCALGDPGGRRLGEPLLEKSSRQLGGSLLGLFFFLHTQSVVRRLVKS